MPLKLSINARVLPAGRPLDRVQHNTSDIRRDLTGLQLLFDLVRFVSGRMAGYRAGAHVQVGKCRLFRQPHIDRRLVGHVVCVANLAHAIACHEATAEDGGYLVGVLRLARHEVFDITDSAVLPSPHALPLHRYLIR